MNITPIRTKADHKAALKTVESLMDAKANTPEGDRLDVLVTLVEAYERAHFPMDLPANSRRPRSGDRDSG
jgi:HTH-type transcriptional regulator / antitoxin HigA